MNDKRPSTHRPSSGLNMADIYFVLFRHKWVILICSLLGFIAAGVIYVMRPTVYTSEAEVEVKYVRDTGSVPISGPDGQTQQLTGGSEGLLYTEIAILSSYDLALRVASNVPPAKILAKYGGGDSIVAAAGVVHNNLTIDRVPRSSVLKIDLSLRDESMVQPVLNAVIEAYVQRHLEIHMMSSTSDQLQRQTDDIHTQLLDIESKLQKKQSVLGVTDVEGARRSNEDQAGQLRFHIISAQAELEQHKAMVAKLKGITKAPVSKTETNTVAEPDLAADKVDRYLRNNQLLEKLKKDSVDLRSIYSEQSAMVQENQAHIDKAEKLKAKLEKEEPRLARQKLNTPSSNGMTGSTATADALFTEEIQVAAQESKIKVLQAEAAEINASIAKLDAAASDIKDLERNRELLEEKWKSFQTRFQTEKLDSEVQAARNANIATIQLPPPPVREREKTPKMMGMAAAGGIVLGLALAFLLEFYVDHSIKRPKEIEGDMNMRLFLSIPDMKRNGHRRKVVASARKKKLLASSKNSPAPEVPAVNGDANVEIAPWDEKHSLHQYNEALRDRLISYFESNHLNHKPKLVAVTGASKGAGTSTIAAGLAASLSETGDGNVLLVDMNMEHGAAQQFYMGKPTCELDAALANETRDVALVQNHLYLANGRTNGDALSRMLPKRFATLMPKLKASDYDYIIFDMPPIARTGVTQRLSSFMDMMLLVVEAEKTSREVVKQAGALLTESKADVSVILNKTRTHIPARLHQEF